MCQIHYLLLISAFCCLGISTSVKPIDPKAYMDGYLHGLEHSSSVMLGVDPSGMRADERLGRIGDFTSAFERGKKLHASINENVLYSSDINLSIEPSIELRTSRDLITRQSAYFSGHFAAIQLVSLNNFRKKVFDIQVPNHHLKSSADYYKGIHDAVALMIEIGLPIKE